MGAGNAEKHATKDQIQPTLEQIIHGETDDETWNAAQKQYLLEAWMPNNLRMYWGKQLVGWRKTPQDAWRTACYLNDRFQPRRARSGNLRQHRLVFRQTESSVGRAKKFTAKSGDRGTRRCGNGRAFPNGSLNSQTRNLSRFRPGRNLNVCAEKFVV